MSPKPLREFILIQEKIRSDRETSKKPCIYEGDIDQSIKDHFCLGSSLENPFAEGSFNHQNCDPYLGVQSTLKLNAK
jgi:hypothetical protein